jgi:pimeloyl-ACP methyl ester carboxylesterase
MIAFHGFGSDGSVFHCWEDILLNNITLYAVDLPFHGKTRWNTDYYDQKDMAFIVDAILIMENKRQFEALGFSLGGRIWLRLQEHFANRITALFLLAPDGLGTSGMSLVDWMPLGLRKVLSGITRHKRQVLFLSGSMYRNGWLSSSAYRYLRHQLKDEARRRRLVQTWYSTSFFSVTPRIAVRIIKKYAIPTMVITGQADQMVAPEKIKPVFAPLEDVLYQEINANHQSLIPASKPFVKDGLVRYWKWLKGG